MKLVYIAGPYTGQHFYQEYMNVYRAWLMGTEVARLGAMPVIPQQNTAFMDGVQPYRFWLEGTMEIMRRCDAVLVLSDYDESKGTLGEIDEARRLDMPLFFDLEDLTIWLEDQGE